MKEELATALCHSVQLWKMFDLPKELTLFSRLASQRKRIGGNLASTLPNILFSPNSLHQIISWVENYIRGHNLPFMTRKWQLSEFLPIFKDGMLGDVITSSDFDQLSESNQLLSSHMWTMLHETFLEIEKKQAYWGKEYSRGKVPWAFLRSQKLRLDKCYDIW